MVKGTKTDAVAERNPYFDQPGCQPIGAAIELSVADLYPGFVDGRLLGERERRSFQIGSPIYYGPSTRRVIDT